MSKNMCAEDVIASGQLVLSCMPHSCNLHECIYTHMQFVQCILTTTTCKLAIARKTEKEMHMGLF